MNTTLYFSLSEVIDPDIHIVECRYKGEGGRIGLDIDHDSSKLFERVLSGSSYVWDYPNNRLVDFTTLNKDDGNDLALRRVCSRTEASHKVIYKLPLSSTDLISDNDYKDSPLNPLMNYEKESIQNIFKKILDAYRYFILFDSQLSPSFITKDYNLVKESLRLWSDDLSCDLQEVDKKYLPVW